MTTKAAQVKARRKFLKFLLASAGELIRPVTALTLSSYF